MRTPLIVKVPGVTKGLKSQSITEYIDIYPSLCELVNIKSPTHLEGESFIKLIKELKRNKDFTKSKYRDAIALIKGNMIYMEWADDEGKSYNRMLFDHSIYPMELDNLAEKSDYKEVVSSLSNDLHINGGKIF